jgi:hypothetical protein
VQNWQAIAFNQVPHSANEIHGDKVAKAYGFKGGLVPGVTVSAYLCHPAVVNWGEAWLADGVASINVLSPLYDGETFTVEVSSVSETSYYAQLRRPDGTVSASAEVGLPSQTQVAPCKAPERRVDVMASKRAAPPAVQETMQKLREQGCFAVAFNWLPAHEMHTYLHDEAQLPRLHQMDGGGLANMSFILGCSNWVLARNVYMNPWVHMATRSQNFAPMPLGTALVAEMAVTDLFTKKGHQFVDVRVALFNAADDMCFTSIDLRAIYRLRGL